MSANASRRFGFGLVIAGGFLLSFAGSRYALGAERADRARTEWESMQAKRAVARARASTTAMNRATESVNGAPIAHLLIPRIGLDEIVLEGVGGDELNAGPGHVPGSVLPGERGNSVISAHRDRHFSHFDELQIGDSIATESNGHRDAWRIIGIRIVDKNAAALFRTPDATLTLTTCWPVRFVGPAPARLIITAKPIQS